jgi:transcriptional regulator with XRE-family HTH domain
VAGRQPEPNFEALRKATISIRGDLGLTLADLHDRSGIALSMLYRIENGTAGGSLATWYRIAQSLNVPLGDLVKHLEAPLDAAEATT